MKDRSDSPFIIQTAILLATALLVLGSLAFFTVDGLKDSGAGFTLGGAARAAAASARRHFTDFERSVAAAASRAAAGLKTAAGKASALLRGSSAAPAPAGANHGAGAEAEAEDAPEQADEDEPPYGGFSALAAERAADRRDAAEEQRKVEAVARQGGLFNKAQANAPGAVPAAQGGTASAAAQGRAASAAAPAPARGGQEAGGSHSGQVSAAAGKAASAARSGGSTDFGHDELDSLRSGLQKNFERSAAGGAAEAARQAAARPQAVPAPTAASIPKEALAALFETDGGAPQRKWQPLPWNRKKKKDEAPQPEITPPVQYMSTGAVLEPGNDRPLPPKPEPPAPVTKQDPPEFTEITEQRKAELAGELSIILAKITAAYGKPKSSVWTSCKDDEKTCADAGVPDKYLTLVAGDGSTVRLGLKYVSGRWHYRPLDSQAPPPPIVPF